MRPRDLRLRPVVCAFLLLGWLAPVHAGGLEFDRNPFDRFAHLRTLRQLDEGRSIFRFDTFGDERFWGDTLHLHDAISGDSLGGVGPGVSPRTALAVGLKVDVKALPRSLRF